MDSPSDWATARARTFLSDVIAFDVIDLAMLLDEIGAAFAAEFPRELDAMTANPFARKAAALALGMSEDASWIGIVEQLTTAPDSAYRLGQASRDAEVAELRGELAEARKHGFADGVKRTADLIRETHPTAVLAIARATVAGKLDPDGG